MAVLCDALCSCLGLPCHCACGSCGGLCGALCCAGSVCSCSAPTPCPDLTQQAQLALLREQTTQHLVYVLHGVTIDGPSQFRHLRDTLTGTVAEGRTLGVYLALYCVPVSSECCSPLCSQCLSGGGVDAVATRAAAELGTVLRALGSGVQALSIVGHSMGGLAARALAHRIREGRVPAAAGLQLRLFAMLGSPALGVRRTFAMDKLLPRKVLCTCCTACCRACIATASQRCVPFGRDVFLTSSVLPRLAGDGPRAALGAFSRRVVVAPVEDDGVVSYATASVGCKPRRPARGALSGSLVRVAGSPAALEVWDQAAGDTEEAAMRRGLLEAGEWELVEVSAGHSDTGAVNGKLREGSLRVRAGKQVVDLLGRALRGEPLEPAPTPGDTEPFQLRSDAPAPGESQGSAVQPGYEVTDSSARRAFAELRARHCCLAAERYGFVGWLATVKRDKGPHFPTERAWLSYAPPAREWGQSSALAAGLLPTAPALPSAELREQWQSGCAALLQEGRAQQAAAAYCSAFADELGLSGMSLPWTAATPGVALAQLAGRGGRGAAPWADAVPADYAALFRGADPLEYHGYRFLPPLEVPPLCSTV
eukprot:TRINITY_DN46794_c0_g1_i1.p1 TRINITY_DN46794_c0_g1~~TRINITY_DN46794_c0_g1_i1.p1  ORF type:complete len:594 (+),score=156.13 TRINITY_DN46794_c0_g1_i1:95-1876(+)